MKYFDETKMAAIRKTLDAEVMKWPGVVSKGMMGCLCYFRRGKFFAVLVNDGIAVTRLDVEDRAKLSKVKGAKPFEIGGRASPPLSQQPLNNPRAGHPTLPENRARYEAATEPGTCLARRGTLPSHTALPKPL